MSARPAPTSPRPIRAVLIANRGEIAIRVARACRDAGARSIAVYSAADRLAAHVVAADEAYDIGPAPASESYLNIAALLAVARQAGADAVHPGYGFLAENAAFARALIEAGLVWIGPPPAAIETMGDKIRAKALMGAAGVPLAPGSPRAGDDAELAAWAEGAGYPVLVKAAAGGGGRGMRIAVRPEELPAALAAARREAAAAFGDGRVFLERYLVEPRHIEVQIVADHFGNVIHLGERECSIQRRHQKVVEESPSPALTPALRAAMGAAAVAAARAVDYRGAGTVEFLLDGQGQFYFLEMNTRLQVEHPVTEEVSGLDLVRLQFAIAAGEPLGVTQADVVPRGHTIECRIYAEDARQGFLPTTGRLHAFVPPGGPGVRNDVGVSVGEVVSVHYDPQLAKLIVSGRDRGEALVRLNRALAEYVVLGPTTNLSFLRWLATAPAFVAGATTTGFIERYWRPTAPNGLPREVLLGAAALEVLSRRERPQRSSRTPNPWLAGAWRAGGAWPLVFTHGGQRYQLDLAPAVSAEWRVSGAGLDATIAVDRAGDTIVVRDVTRSLALHGAALPDALLIGWGGETYELARPTARGVDEWTAGAARGGGSGALGAPMPGTILKVLVAPGDEVRMNQALVILEAMKMEHTLAAPRDGVIRAVPHHAGAVIAAGTLVVEFE